MTVLATIDRLCQLDPDGHFEIAYGCFESWPWCLEPIRTVDSSAKITMGRGNLGNQNFDVYVQVASKLSMTDLCSEIPVPQGVLK
jgi:hypothetical protein